MWTMWTPRSPIIIVLRDKLRLTEISAQQLNVTKTLAVTFQATTVTTCSLDIDVVNDCFCGAVFFAMP